MNEEKKPRERKNALLWQAYLFWREFLKGKNRHLTRIKHIEGGRSNMDADFERRILKNVNYDAFIKIAKEDLAMSGEAVGPIWIWLTSIRGIGDHLAAKLLAQIDDIGRFATQSKLRRFAGLAVINGKAEGKDSQHYNRELKAMLVGKLGIVCEFIAHHTYPYRDLYDQYRERDQRKHPDVMCKQCGCKWDDCPRKKTHKRSYNDGHMDRRAKRKVAQVFLSHLWQVWRALEGLPCQPSYVEGVLGHANIVPPPNWPGPVEGESGRLNGLNSELN